MRPDVLPSHEEMTTHHSDGKSMIDRYTYMHIYIFLLPARAWSRFNFDFACLPEPSCILPNETSNSFDEWCPIPSLFARSRRIYLQVAFSLFNIRFCNIRCSLYTNLDLDCYLKLYLLIRSFCLLLDHSVFALCFVISYIYFVPAFSVCAPLLLRPSPCQWQGRTHSCLYPGVARRSVTTFCPLRLCFVK